jgi:5-methylcytosine-specific restriction endonuclease McrA
MRIELILFLITVFIVLNIYYEGRILKNILFHKKYYKIAGVVFGAFVLYVLIKKNPLHANQIITSTNEYIKYIPLDKTTAGLISPILDFTTKHDFGLGGGSGGGNNIDNERNPIISMPERKHSLKEYVHGDKIKRSVSDTKKKFVAARQQWKCGQCKQVLDHTYEIDHMVALMNGGTNQLDNLLALCPQCHRNKTFMERMEI